MTISFSQIPGALRVPLVAVEIDASQASQGPAVQPYRALLIGQKTAGGTADADALYKVTSVAQVGVLAGQGSMLHRMAMAWFASNTFTETWIGVLADNGAGVAATANIALTGPATEDGTFHLFIGGVYVPVAVSDGDTDAEIATAIGAAINADEDLPVTATVADDDVTVAFRHKGEVGNDHDTRINYRDGQALPAGVGAVITEMASGTTNPSLTGLIAAMGDQQFHIIAHPYYDDGSLDDLEAELDRRFGPMVMIPGVAFTSADGTHSALTTLGDTRNSPHSVIVAQAGANPITPPMEFAAEVAALVALHGQADPARPFQTLALTKALPPAESDLFTLAERNLQLFDGIATTKVTGGGKVRLDRMITTYQVNEADSPDPAYLDVTTLLTLMYLRYSFAIDVQEQYPRHKLADDGNAFGPGQAVVTPKDIKATAIGWFKTMMSLGLVENLDQFKRDVVVERNEADRNRVDVLLPPDLINQLITTAAKIQFRL